jgi:Zn-dependent peptidase ImmA (M78 family)
MSDPRTEAARREARQLSYRFGVTAPEHIRLEAFAARLGVEIHEVALQGAGCQLIRKGTRGTILVPEHMTDPLYRRFSIAHELGHFVLRHPGAGLAPPAHHRREELRDYELEANAFASELLMPEALVRAEFGFTKVDLNVPWQIAKRFEVSILASSIRFIELASERCAAVFSAGGKISWVRASDSLTVQIPYRPLLPSSLAHAFFERGSLVELPTYVPAEAWFLTAAQVDILEHSTCHPEYGTVLSMLWIPPAAAPILTVLS